MRTCIPVMVLLAITALPQFAAERQRIQTLYIGPVVQGFDDNRFHRLLTLELERAGFVILDNREEAQAVVAGSMSVWAEAGGAFTATLTSSDGRRLWQGSVPNPKRFRTIRCDDRDTLTALAQNIAKAMRKAVR